MNRRTMITAAPAALLATTVPALAGDPDAELHRMLTEQQGLMERSIDGTKEDVDRLHAVLERIADYRPQTVKGVAAKLRLGFDEDELRSHEEGGPLDRIGAASVRDVLRLLGEA